MTNTEVAVYGHPDKEIFRNMEDVVKSLGNDLPYYLPDIVRYNIRYRDALRSGGFNGLLTALFKESGHLRKRGKALTELHDAVEKWGPLADYDIQCHSHINTFEVLGHVTLLKYVDKAVGWLLPDGGNVGKTPSAIMEYDEPGLNILLNYKYYPTFDAADRATEKRSFYRYYFLRHPFTDEDIEKVRATFEHFQFGPDEKIPFVQEMPILYYPGTGGSFLLVSAKD